MGRPGEQQPTTHRGEVDLLVRGHRLLDVELRPGQVEGLGAQRRPVLGRAREQILQGIGKGCGVLGRHHQRRVDNERRAATDVGGDHRTTRRDGLEAGHRHRLAIGAGEHERPRPAQQSRDVVGGPEDLDEVRNPSSSKGSDDLRVGQLDPGPSAEQSELDAPRAQDGSGAKQVVVILHRVPTRQREEHGTGVAVSRRCRDVNAIGDCGQLDRRIVHAVRPVETGLVAGHHLVEPPGQRADDVAEGARAQRVVAGHTGGVHGGDADPLAARQQQGRQVGVQQVRVDDVGLDPVDHAVQVADHRVHGVG